MPPPTITTLGRDAITTHSKSKGTAPWKKAVYDGKPGTDHGS
jgi:hypothetical protein